jgi:hypothetical protein
VCELHLFFAAAQGAARIATKNLSSNRSSFAAFQRERLIKRVPKCGEIRP